MTEVRQVLLEQLAACNDKNGWFVSMSSALEGLTAEQAAWRPDASGHSIWQILNHLFFWNDRYLRRYQGLPVPEAGENAATFDSQPSTGSEDEWRAARAQFRAVMDGWASAIEKADMDKLASAVREGSTDTWHSTLANLTLHTAHHVGQIVTLRRTQGSWDSKKGVS